jgi:peptidoglycan/xylan/chitin deacetylase (PgdA/CDA1 family)
MTRPSLEAAAGQLAAGHFIRVVNYHSTPRSGAEALERELARYAEQFAPVTLEALDRYVDTGTWSGDRPGFLPVFYEGYRNSVDVAAPLLDRLGLTGWFPIATSFVDCPPEHQEAFARSHWIALVEEDTRGGRIAMDWDEVGALAERHVVLGHTAHHEGYDTVFTDEDLEREVAEPARRIEAATGRPTPGFVWLHGSSWGHQPRHDQAVRDAGYRYLFSNTMIHRIA